MSNSDTLTPRELATELGHPDQGKRIRAWARENFQHEHQQRWHFRPDEVAEIRAAFA